MKKTTLILSMLMAASVCGLALGRPATTAGVISDVTVYRGQALVTRTIRAELGKGTSELVVSNLPGRILSESLYAQAQDGVSVLSVRYRERAVREDTREEVKQLDTEIEGINRQIARLDRNHQHGGNLWRVYEQLWKLTADGSNIDLAHGLLQAKQIESLAQFLEDKWNSLHQSALELEDEKEKLKKDLELLQRKRRELDAGRSRTEREAVLFVKSPAEKKSVIRLSYLVNGANWLAQYNLRADPAGSNVLIEYNAVVNQTSGEDWNGVNVSLSTAEPTTVAAAPTLEPMLVRPTRPRPVQQAEGKAKRPRNAVQQMEQYRQKRMDNISAGIAGSVALNEIAAQTQSLFFQAGASDVKRIQEKLVEITRNEGIKATSSS